MNTVSIHTLNSSQPGNSIQTVNEIGETGSKTSRIGAGRERSDLVQLCLNGDDDAWARLVEEYRGLVYSICYLFCGSTQDAEDLVQDTFLKIWMNLASYDPSRGELKGWIATVTR